MSFAIMFHHFHNKFHKKTQGSISGAQLQKVIEYLQSRYNLINSHEFCQKVIDKKIKKKDVCLTFDDCLKSQFDIAFPILKKKNISAFFFIYSSIFDPKPNNLEIFRDFRNTKFSNIDKFYECFFNLLKKNYFQDYLLFEKKFKRNYLMKYKFYTLSDRKFRFCRDKILSHNIYEKIMFLLMKQKKYNLRNAKIKLFMSKKNIKSLIKNQNSIGLHSDSHPINIYKLSFKRQYKDYKKNYNFLIKNFKIKTTSMSHPFGRYNKNTLKVLKKLGIKVGFLSSPAKFNKSNLEIGRIDHNLLIKKIK